MSFSYSGGVITQTGTDSNLSLISGLTGVTTSVKGAVTSYSLDATITFEVEGHLTIDPRVNFLEMLKDGNASLKVTATGTLILGADLSYSFGTQVTRGLAFRAIGRSTQPWVSYLRSDGIIEWYGATLDMGGGIETRNGGSTKIREGVFISQLSQGGSAGHQIFFGVGSTCDIIGLTKTLGTGTSSDSASVGITGISTVTNLSGVTSTGDVAADNRSATLAPVPYVSMNGFTPLGKSLLAATTALSHIIDCTGLYVDNLQIGRRGAYGTVTRHGQAEAYKTCNGKLTLNSVGVAGTKVAWTDVDNGGRGTTAATEWGQEYLTDRTYTDTTDVNGEFTQSVLEAAWYTTNPLATAGWQGASADKRLEASEKITFKCFSYLNSPSTIQFVGNTTTPSDALSPQGADPSITELIKATVDAYSVIDTPSEFYDRAKSYRYDNFAEESDTMVSRSGELVNAGAFDIDIDATAGSAFNVVGNKITIKSSEFIGSITTTGTINLLNGASNIGTLTDFGGTVTTLQYSVTGLVNNSRIQLYNVTTSSEILNVVNGTTLDGTYTEGGNFTNGDTVRLRATNTIGLVGYKEYESTVIASATGFSFLVNQELDAVYSSLGIDGSTVTNFTADYVNDEVDITVTTDFLLSDFYAWWEYTEYSEQGIRLFFGGLTGVDEANFNIHNAIIDIKLDNTTATNVSQLDNRRLYRDDLTRPVVAITSGGGGIDVEWRSPVLLANSDAIESDITAIKNVTDNTMRVDSGTSIVTGTLLNITKGV